MNSTLARLSTGRIIDLAAVVAARPYLQDGKLEGNGPHQGLSLYLTGGHQVTLIGPEAEDMIDLLCRTRLLVDHLAKPNPVPETKPQRAPGYKGGEAVKLHGYVDRYGKHTCPSCTTLIFPVTSEANVTPVFGTVFDQDTYRCSQCGTVC